MLPSLLVIIYLVNNPLLKIYGDHVPCDKLNLQSNNDQKTIICSDTYSKIFKPSFIIKFYGMPYENISIGIDGFMTLKHSNDEYPKIGFITMLLIRGDTRFQVEIGNNVKANCYIYRNGKISFYYEKIPDNIKEILLWPMMNNGLWCSHSTHPTPIKKEYSAILTHESLIEDGTLVEFEPMSDVCDIHNTKDLCINTNRAESQCYWCSMIEKCSNGRDYHADIWMKNGCDANNISQPQRPQNLTPKGIRESAVQTTNVNNNNSQNQCRRNSTSKGLRESVLLTTTENNISFSIPPNFSEGKQISNSYTYLFFVIPLLILFIIFSIYFVRLILIRLRLLKVTYDLDA
ncbi:unnamed protein product [Schistosoma haematobium]|nr:unnamed protein product [Schistosoma haematobium]